MKYFCVAWYFEVCANKNTCANPIGASSYKSTYYCLPTYQLNIMKDNTSSLDIYK